MAAKNKSRDNAFDFGESGGTAFTDRRVPGIFTDVSGVIPTAITFAAFGLVDRDFQRRNQFGVVVGCARGQEIDLRNDEEPGQLRQMIIEPGSQFRIAA
jgi:hypothetical protein